MVCVCVAGGWGWIAGVVLLEAVDAVVAGLCGRVGDGGIGDGGDDAQKEHESQDGCEGWKVRGWVGLWLDRVWILKTVSICELHRSFRLPDGFLAEVGHFFRGFRHSVGWRSVFIIKRTVFVETLQKKWDIFENGRFWVRMGDFLVRMFGWRSFSLRCVKPALRSGDGGGACIGRLTVLNHAHPRLNSRSRMVEAGQPFALRRKNDLPYLTVRTLQKLAGHQSGIN